MIWKLFCWIYSEMKFCGHGLQIRAIEYIIRAIVCINSINYHHAPVCSGSTEILKAIFSWHGKATKGSSCNGSRKKAFEMRARAKSWIRHKKIVVSLNFFLQNFNFISKFRRLHKVQIFGCFFHCFSFFADAFFNIGFAQIFCFRLCCHTS